jgi:DNA polymerase elongation subunit (family B)
LGNTIARLSSNNTCLVIDNWIAFDLEWEPESEHVSDNAASYSQHSYNTDLTSVISIPPPKDYHKIITFGYEDSHSNKGTLDISDFSNCSNPQRTFLISINDKLIQYKYCFAWGSKAIKHKNEENSKLEGINGDLVMLDDNFRCNGISSIIKYDKFSGMPYIKNNNYNSSSNKTSTTVDIDLLKVFAKPLVKYVVFKNKYKSLRLHEVVMALLGYGKLDYKSGSCIEEMSVEERKAYCLQDAHIVADLIRIKNGDILKIMQVIANHTRLKLDEVCHKGMTSIWNKILNEAISKRISLVGYDNIPSSLHKLYSNTNYQSSEKYEEIEYDLVEKEFEDGEEDEEYRDEQNQYFEDRLDNCYSDSKQELLQQHSKPKKNAKEAYKKYKGAIVLDPERGLHSDVYLFDVTSLYPTMITKYNLSPETVNCSCCKNNPKARELFTPDISKDCNYIPAKEECYWICQRRKGLFAKRLQELTEERIKYKSSGLKVESQAIKAIINSGYGVFGHPYFKYYDPRVAELVTAFGRDTLTKMQEVAKELGFVVLYGDTDSLFVNNLKNIDDVNKFISECKSKLRVDVGHDRTFSKLILVGKKHYVGILSDPDKEPIIKGMEGIKSDRPEFIRRVFRQLINDIKYGNDPIPKLNQALEELNSRNVPSELLTISLILRKDPTEYEHSCKQNRLGTKLGLHKGDTLVYYKSDIKQPVYDTKTKQRILQFVHESTDPNDISYAKYKEMFVNAFKDILEILGYNIEKDLLTSKKKLKESSYFKREST